MNKKYWNIPSIIFNIIETLLLIFMAWYLKIGIINTLLAFFSFQISRFYFKFPKHYKDWRKCLIWTLLIFTSMFLVAKINIFVGCLCNVFCAYILSGKADIKDMYMWKNDKESKYKLLEDYIKYNRLCDGEKLIDIEKDAFEYEFIRINELRAKNQCVCNIYNGGAGGTVSWWNDEKKKQYSINNVMKSEKQRERMKKNNPMSNPEIAEKTNGQKRIPVIIDEKKYISLKQASIELGVVPDTIRQWCKKGHNTKGIKCEFEKVCKAISNQA